MKKLLFLFFLTPYMFGDICTYECSTITNNKFAGMDGFKTTWTVDTTKKSVIHVSSGRESETILNQYLEVLWWNDSRFGVKSDNGNSILNDGSIAKIELDKGCNIIKQTILE